MHEGNGKVQIKTKVQIKQLQKNQDPKNTYHRDTGRTWTGTGTWIKADAARHKQNTMTGQGVKGTQRINTQTLMNRQGTGEVDQQVR